ncbi:site-specific integrase [Polyangium sp. y55x31]|uniref:site-specific integrase n=1 Tax=Polyangium sp. y55x31 TaxID=3042688 RepID=UPI002482AA07|nr:site-specific integrase [Polyangium sp. y55x31]MDI1483571.1 site-specific integrase [Polyangium sp. y55x31]
MAAPLLPRSSSTSALTAPLLLEDLSHAAAHAKNARASSTRAKYARAWQTWEAYALDVGVCPLPADPLVVAAYLAHLANEGLAPPTLGRILAALVDRHRTEGHPSPGDSAAVRNVMRGIRRSHARPPRQVAPLSVSQLRRIVEALPKNLNGLRDRALLLVGFGAALRRSELVALQIDHVAWMPEGVLVRVLRSKTDQEGRGVEVPIHATGGPLCPVAALRAWIEGARIKSGPIFRSVDHRCRLGRKALSDRSVALIVQRAAKRAGYDAGNLAGHSLRAGFATQAARAGANLAEIGRVTRHASEGMLRRYIRLGTAFEKDPLRGALGL